MSKKALYIGNSDTAFLFFDVAEQTETELETYNAVSANKENIINKALSESYEIIIFNVAELLEAVDDTLNIIKAIVSGSKAKLIVMAQGYASNSHLVVEAAKAGVGYFMLSKDTAGLKEVFISTKANIKNVYNLVDAYRIPEQQSANEFVSAAEKFSYKTVSVAGCMARIGTTSVAIQLVKFFQSQGKTACFIDNSNTGYMELSKNYYLTDDADEQMNRITLEGIDIYYNVTAEIMQQIYIKNYNFIVFDVGNISENTAKQTEFLQKDYRILCTGCKPNESIALEKLLQNIYQTKIAYMYSFVPKNERDGIMEDVKGLNQKCYFTPYFDECYSLTSDSIPLFKDIFNDVFPADEEIQEQPIKKKGLFGKRKKDKKQKRKESTDESK